jgi:hypothetical protein
MASYNARATIKTITGKGSRLIPNIEVIPAARSKADISMMSQFDVLISIITTKNAGKIERKPKNGKHT